MHAMPDNELLHLIGKYPKDSKVIVLDSDGVVTDFVGSYCAFVRGQGHDHVHEDHVKSYTFLAEDFGIEPDRSNYLFKAFTNSGAFKNMKLYPGTRELFDYLKDAGWVVVIATDVPTRAELQRMSHYETELLHFHDIVFTAAKARCARHLTATVVVDDKISNLTELLTDCGAIVAKVTHPFNASMAFPEKRIYAGKEVECWDLGSPKTALAELLRRVKKIDGVET